MNPRYPRHPRSGQDSSGASGSRAPCNTSSAPSYAQGANAQNCNAMAPCCRIYFISAANDAVPVGGTGTAIMTPQDPFQAQEIVLSSTRTAPFFDLLDIKVGSQSQSVSNTNAPTAGDVFSEVAVRSSMTLDPTWAGVAISIGFANVDPLLPHDFRVTVFGYSVAGYQGC